MTISDDFISNYLEYCGVTECPVFYHRWCCISMIAAYLGRQYNTNIGRAIVNPNHYCMLIGDPASRKSTAIKTSKSIIKLAGYDKISAEKTSKEKFLLDLGESNKSADVLDTNLWGDSAQGIAEMYIACDEFNDFIGDGNFEFISLLGNFWDYEGTFENRIKSGKCAYINEPTINILGGNTPVSFARAFPPTILGQGFFSRLLLIYGEPTGRRITWPKESDAGETNEIVTRLQQIKIASIGKALKGDSASNLIDKIYQSWNYMDDVRFKAYSGRRLTHLLKLCLITSAARMSNEISEHDVLYANTILTHTEFLMPKALGEFGKSRNSDTTHKVMQILDSANYAMPMTDIWKELSNELERVNDLAEILRNLLLADKIFSSNGGYLVKKVVLVETRDDVVDYGLLTQEERNMTK